MGKYEIICETKFVSRGTIKERKTSIEESFKRLIDAEIYMGRLYTKYNKEMSHQLDEKIKFINYRDKHLIITIDNGNFEPIMSKLYYIRKRM